MSRCFPYPPPGYVRNPVAVAVAEAETTAKLQKEREKAEKKKEKRSDRKTLKQSETSKHSKHSHKKRKLEDIGTAGQESKTVKESIEQLEKSGLSEEHGAPCFVQTVRDSPESSQDSSKRRMVVLSSPSQAKNGHIFRIKIKREQDSPRGVPEKPMVLEQPSVKQMGFGSSHLSKPNSIKQQNKVNVKPQTIAHQQINVEPQAIQKQASKQLPSQFTRRDDPQMAKVVQQIEPKLSVKPPAGKLGLAPATVDLLPTKVAQRDLPGKAAPAKVIQRVESQVPSAEIRRKLPPAFPKVSQEASIPASCHQENLQPPPLKKLKVEAAKVSQEAGTPAIRRPENLQPAPVKKLKVEAAFPKVSQEASTPAIHRPENLQPPLVQKLKVEAAIPKVAQVASTPGILHPENLQPPPVQKLKVEAPGINQLQRPIASVSKEEPSSSGRKAEAVKAQEAKKSKSDRKKSRKAEKKEKKFGDLFVTWNPPAFEMEDSDVDADWLFGSTRNSDASMTTSCRASDGSVLFSSIVQQPSLQPTATFLPDLSIYQLPYVVPF